MIQFRPFLAAAAALLLAACASSPSSPSPVAAASTPAAPTVLLVSIDGLRADVLDRGMAPNLSRIAAQGVRARWMNPSYPSLTFPNHYTIVTGLRPDHHGIVNNTMHDAALGGFSLSDRDAVGDARWWGGEPLWAGVQKAGMRAYTWSWPGSEAAVGGIRPTRWHNFDASVPQQARVDEVLGWLSEPVSTRPRLATLYFEHVDHAGHDYGPDSPEYAQAVREVDAAVGRLQAGLVRRGLTSTVDLVIVSDHGMATVAPGHFVVAEDMLPAQLATIVSVGQSVGFEPLPGQQAAAEAHLLGAHPQHDCWRKQDLPARWHYGTHPRIPAIVCQMHEGWDAVRAEWAKRRRADGGTRGSHGFDPALPSMRAVFMASGPSFRQGQTLPPFDNVDVYPLLARLLGIEAAPNDGDPATLLPALRDGVGSPR
ncbi:ectonucleotide pyrophosphatase/phosphodiesterase [Stenotrophomonas sp. MMGLT7]|uniref:alkaline phosphatase family protein n=1 Tax=Stenotrophomonas sp. MMGLT7 TaxID=2901227 RepID=UPI001E542840|nr:ectonucleotide pyrophosphatase/phosphodiesterase [Stenotrophomonas sp. MMGLT7]MCD7099699.1 ectonucleotide pyrophosphatase/phosphodiesterase [Stenotrophomonas sp. MMGLT7]